MIQSRKRQGKDNLDNNNIMCDFFQDNQQEQVLIACKDKELSPGHQKSLLSLSNHLDDLAMLTSLPQETRPEEYLDYKWMNNLGHFIELLLLKYFKASFHVLSYPEIQVGLFKAVLAPKTDLQLKDQMILLRLALLDGDWRFCEKQESLAETLVA